MVLLLDPASYSSLSDLDLYDVIADAVDRVLEDRGSGENEHPDGRVDERDGVQGRDEAGQLADVAQILECFNGTRRGVSTRGLYPG